MFKPYLPNTIAHIIPCEEEDPTITARNPTFSKSRVSVPTFCPHRPKYRSNSIDTLLQNMSINISDRHHYLVAENRDLLRQL
jgi:hypothetical protein